jgi:uncharacterized protein YneF (UPF0154 family)
MLQSPQTFSWVSLVSALGVGTIIGNWLSFRWQRRAWINDNKKAEWRELIDHVSRSLEGMAVAFDPPLLRELSKASEITTAYVDAMLIGERVMQDRIFVAEAVKNKGVVEKWDELKRYVSSVDDLPDAKRTDVPTRTGYGTRAKAFHDELVRVAREDLGLHFGWLRIAQIAVVISLIAVIALGISLWRKQRQNHKTSNENPILVNPAAAQDRPCIPPPPPGYVLDRPFAKDAPPICGEAPNAPK